MIRYALKCAQGHSFESWFQSADAFDGLAERGLISCAVCGVTEVSKAMMAPRVSTDNEERAEPAPDPAPVPEQPASQSARPLADPSHPMEKMLRDLKEHIEKTSTYVGGRFADEARAMHLGETPEKPIHGEANPEEAKSLIEDGVPIAPLPILPKGKTN